ncbi:hypothetical protein CC80DRAFT_505363 [Byssothecium circinans]|uniref:Rhodanese domain-containing protein n=1 Tax=Byssothecium circinans TaxID=147558 RepID=A0A6A5TUY7_9PLEO|nr:hypothetical protein CC80DRAFT_505363 [Byssothecium circinans]
MELHLATCALCLIIGIESIVAPQWLNATTPNFLRGPATHPKLTPRLTNKLWQPRGARRAKLSSTSLTAAATHQPQQQTKMAAPSPKQLLIDVRSPAEFATGALSNDLYRAVNIEYSLIDQLADIYLARGIFIDKDNDITLYCRSGRRSNLALQTLRALGYRNVRDIGGFEDARAVLKKEESERAAGFVKETRTPERDEGEKQRQRAKSFGALLEGLKGLE